MPLPPLKHVDTGNPLLDFGLLILGVLIGTALSMALICAFHGFMQLIRDALDYIGDRVRWFEALIENCFACCLAYLGILCGLLGLFVWLLSISPLIACLGLLVLLILSIIRGFRLHFARDKDM